MFLALTYTALFWFQWNTGQFHTNLCAYKQLKPKLNLFGFSSHLWQCIMHRMGSAPKYPVVEPSVACFRHLCHGRPVDICYHSQSLWYSDALRYSPFSSKYSTRRFRNLSLLTVSASHTMQHCRLARVTATFIRL